MLADSLESLKKYDWGTNMSALAPIEDAVIAAHGNAGASRELEQGLIAALKGNLSRDAHDYVCRKLTIVGTAAAVPTLAGLLGSKVHSHMARYALERINAPEAADALRDALGTVSGSLKIGVISSLGARRDPAAAAPLGRLIGEGDPAIVRAAALALGSIGTAESAAVLQSAHQAGSGNRQALIDGLLSCAESLLRSGQRGDARAIYMSLSGEQQGRLVRLAATRGLLACERNPA
jgi:HEAT repeat protein